VESVTPTGWGNPSENTSNYGYGFGYDANNELTSVSLMDGENSTATTLVNKLVNRDNGTVTTMQRRSSTEIDTATVLFDKYGRTGSIAENNDTTARFGRQDEAAINDASEGASEVTWMVDNLEDRVYHYTYDDHNNCTGYRRHVRNADGTNGSRDFSVERQGERGDTFVTYNRGISGRERWSETTYDENNALLSPRVSITNDFRLPSSYGAAPSFVTEVRYNYDNLGRIGTKRLGGFEGFCTTTNNYIRGTLLKSSVNVSVSGGSFSRLYNYNYRYDERGRIKSVHWNDSTQDQFTYDNANRLTSERLANGNIRHFRYNPDGSIAREWLNDYGNMLHHTYKNGRLTQRGFMPYTYDNLGNCTNFNGVSLDWTRGSLLERWGVGGGTTYSYNSKGVRYQKVVGGITTRYFHDGDKLIEEHRGNRIIRYMYDTEGIVGFSIDTTGRNTLEYFYIKDAEGSVRAIVCADTNTSSHHNQVILSEVARYSYDAWGNAVETITLNNATIDGMPVADFNPIRWKSQYFDRESGFYAISGGSGTRYYSPMIRQYLSPDYSAINPGVIYGLNPYLLTVDNPVSLTYNGHTIATAMSLAFDPPELTRWQHFLFRSGRFFSMAFSWWDDLPNALKWVIGIAVVVLTIAMAAITGGMSAKLKATIGIAAKSAKITKAAKITKGMAWGAGLSGLAGFGFGGLSGFVGGDSWCWDGTASGFGLGAITGGITGGLGGIGLSPLQMALTSMSVTGAASLLTKGPVVLTDWTFYLGMAVSFGGGWAGGAIGGRFAGTGARGLLIGISTKIVTASLKEVIGFIPNGDKQNSTNNIHETLLLARI